MTTRISMLATIVFCVASAASPGDYQGAPFLGHPQTIPGRVQAEFYDLGGQGVAYNDTEAENQGSGKLNKGDKWVDRFRKDEGVDISYTKTGIDKTVDGAGEQPGELYLGWTAPGELVKYTVEVRETGTYTLSAHLSSRTDAAQISLAFDGAPPSAPIALPTTGHWHTWRMADRLAEVHLDKGPHVMTLAVLKEGNFNIDYLEFEPAGQSAPTFTAAEASEQVKRMGRGVNIIGYDPLWNSFSKARFHERHFARIHDGGFQTVRLNLQAFAHMDSANQLDPVWLSTLDWAIDHALANHLMVIVDEHDFTQCGDNAETCRPRLKAFWQQISEHYKDAPANVIFEILNEPNGKLTPAAWNEVLKENLAIIRATNPARTVVIGPAFWNSINALRSLELPADDRNIIVTVHYYLPMTFTHQGASWNAGTAKLSGITWGTDAEKRRVETDFAGVQAWSKAHDRPILLGEFGAYDKGEMESRVRYTAHVARTAESLGWAWTYWQFDSDFIAYNIEKDEWVEPIRRALVPAPAQTTLQIKSRLGTNFYSLADEKGAVAAARQNLAADPQIPGLLLKLAQAQIAVWQDKEAVETLTGALNISPADAGLLLERCHRELPLREFAHARDDLSRAAALDPKNMAAYYHLGLAHYFLGEFAPAADAFRRAVETAPNTDERINSTNWLYAALRRAQRPAEAAKALETVPAEMTNKEPHTRFYLNLVRFFQGRMSEAEALPPAPRPDDPDNEAELAFDTVAYGIGNWHLYNGDTAKAQEYFRRILQGRVWVTWGFVGAETDLQRLPPGEK